MDFSLHHASSGLSTNHVESTLSQTGKKSNLALKKTRSQWSNSLDDKLLEEIDNRKISNYPLYIKKTNEKAKWALHLLHTESNISIKQLKDRFYEVISKKLNRSEFNADEDALILAEAPKHFISGRYHWGEIALLLFERLGDPEALYRSLTQIKNRYAKLTKRHSPATLSTSTEKKRRITEHLDRPFKKNTLIIHEDPITGIFSIRMS